jgi:hypothetical protein
MMIKKALLSRCIDYAGLFPPAALDLRTTVENYRAYRTSEQAWAVGRFILPVGKATEFAQIWPSLLSEWPISLLLGEDAETEWHRASACDFLCDMLECKPLPAKEILAVRRALPAAAKVFFEVPATADSEGTIAAIAASGSMAKLRTGGITHDAIPSASQVARFLSCCVRHGVAFKATAGLHHAIHGVHPLTYSPQSDTAIMHGYVNVILAAVLLHNGGELAEASELLEEASPADLRLDREHISWRDWSFTPQQVVHVRKELMLSFGSCSFTEPLDEIVSMEHHYAA